MRAKHGAAGRVAIPVVAALTALTLTCLFARSTQAPVKGKTPQIASTTLSPCANAKLSNRDFLVGCVGDALAVFNKNTHLRYAHATELTEMALWTRALADGRMDEKSYMDASFTRVETMLKTTRDTPFVDASDMEWALSDLKSVLGHRKVGIMKVMGGAQLAIAN